MEWDQDNKQTQKKNQNTHAQSKEWEVYVTTYFLHMTSLPPPQNKGMEQMVSWQTLESTTTKKKRVLKHKWFWYNKLCSTPPMVHAGAPSR